MLARGNELLVPQAESALDQLKMETAQELGLLDKIHTVGWGNMTTREAGSIGGHMVRKMVNAAEASLMQNAAVARVVGPPMPTQQPDSALPLH